MWESLIGSLAALIPKLFETLSDFYSTVALEVHQQLEPLLPEFSVNQAHIYNLAKWLGVLNYYLPVVEAWALVQTLFTIWVIKHTGFMTFRFARFAWGKMTSA